ncbi:hypothetical protein [Methylovulum psychrotolerans]|jgi:hypothetical protein|uniref:Sulfotransferase domain-containing protein n=1 Tax=Methylovulum psychrotolerans TaxID=1704499 RepID=A0A1Z4C267_9GAMM|nr:hypothetical protein [Methylovulum psychrotolerans]ASF47604.1 hypothetical protein CEK71_16890 [Methylovulum psychrotolerans]MBT9099286.1 hypothetical protein [Methylovulum psychrotolerans]
MNFIFHIGTHKTGSTALQSFLFSNRDMLLKLGILYPTTGLVDKAHHDVAWMIGSGNVNKVMELFAKIESEASALGLENVLLSSEEFEFIRNMDILKNHIAKKFKIKTIVFIRRPDFYLESEYNQHVRMYSIRFKNDIYKFYFHIDFLTRLNYRHLCSSWNSFSDVNVINYDHCLTEKQAIFKALIKHIGIDWDDSFSIPYDRESNISLSSIGTIYLSRMNRLDFSPSLHQNAIKVVSETFDSLPKRWLLSLEDKLTLWRRFDSTNSFVSKHYNVEPFAKPCATESMDETPIDYHSDFNEDIFCTLLNQIKE